MVLTGIPAGFLLAVLATGYCRLRRYTNDEAKPVILLSALLGFLIGAFGPILAGAVTYYR